MRVRRAGLRPRSRWTAAAAVLSAVLLSSCGPPPSPAADPAISCSSVAGTVSYAPPATGVPADTTLSTLPGALVSGCTDLSGSGITGGSLDLSVDLPDFSCNPSIGTLLGGELGSGSGQISWSDGSTSDLDATVRVGGAAGFSVWLTVTGGRYVGTSSVLVMAGVSSTGSCTPSDPLTTLTLASNGPFVLHPSPTSPFGPLTDVAQISAGGAHTCVLLTSGAVRCWGSNSDGQLGNVLLTPGATTNLPVEVTGLGGAVQVSAGDDHTCAVLGDGGVRCWGSNELGKLGTGTAISSSPVPLPVAGVDDAVAVEAGGSHTCAVLSDQSVRCWGANAAGQLGNGTNTANATPVVVTGLGASQIRLGDAHTCALVVGGSVKCWGLNDDGQLGILSTQSVNVPATVEHLLGNPPVLDVAVGSGHSCALSVSSNPLCWGANDQGQLGRGTVDDDPHPEAGTSQPWVGATDLTAGAGHTCARLMTGPVACWGDNGSGQLGDGTSVDASRARLVLGLTGALQLSAGGSHTCAVLPGGRASCWGDNGSGQLGDGSSLDRSRPVPVVAL